MYLALQRGGLELGRLAQQVTVRSHLPVRPPERDKGRGTNCAPLTHACTVFVYPDGTVSLVACRLFMAQSHAFFPGVSCSVRGSCPQLMQLTRRSRRL
jgi:hypothetical protein